MCVVESSAEITNVNTDVVNAAGSVILRAGFQQTVRSVAIVGLLGSSRGTEARGAGDKLLGLAA